MYTFEEYFYYWNKLLFNPASLKFDVAIILKFHVTKKTEYPLRNNHLYHRHVILLKQILHYYLQSPEFHITIILEMEIIIWYNCYSKHSQFEIVFKKTNGNSK